MINVAYSEKNFKLFFKKKFIFWEGTNALNGREPSRQNKFLAELLENDLKKCHNKKLG
jgi:hypothetical protein